MNKEVNVQDLNTRVSRESGRERRSRTAGPDARTREVQPRIRGRDVETADREKFFDFEIPAGLDVRSEIKLPEISTGQRVGSVSAGLSLVRFGLKRKGILRIGATAAGAALLIQGATGRQVVKAARRFLGGRKALVPIKIHETLTIFRSREEIYAIWRSLETLPHYMRHLADVERLDATRSKWTFEVPKLKTQLQWISELTVIEENRRLAWRSEPGGDVATAGDVRFEDAPGGKGTVVRIRLAYWPPAGAAGRGLSQVFNPAFEALIREDLRRVKFYIEAEEIPVGK